MLRDRETKRDWDAQRQRNKERQTERQRNKERETEKQKAKDKADNKNLKQRQVAHLILYKLIKLATK